MNAKISQIASQSWGYVGEYGQPIVETFDIEKFSRLFMDDIIKTINTAADRSAYGYVLRDVEHILREHYGIQPDFPDPRNQSMTEDEINEILMGK